MNELRGDRGRGAWLVFGLLVLVGGNAMADPVPSEVLEAEQSRIDVIARASRASISVFGSRGPGGGSGVVISPDGYALSNFHVVKPSGDFMKCSMPDGQLYDAVVVGIDPTGDVALIKLLGRDDFPFAELGDSQQLRAGDWCFAVGNPFLLATDFQPTVTFGMVSGVHRYQYPADTLLEYADCIQVDASVNPGNSGGPLFNMKGQLVGINGRCSFEKRGRVNVGVAYAISINQIKNFLGHLHSGRIVDHATLGAIVASDDEGRVVVVNVLESSDAYRRGLRLDDEIIAFGGRPIHSVNAFKNTLGIFPRGWRVPLSFRRDGQRFDCLVRLPGVHSREELISKVQRPVVPTPERRPGERPRPNPPERRPGEGPRPRERPRPPRPRMPEQAPMPEHVAKFFEARRGYANYYFNQFHRDRVWKAFLEHGRFASLAAPWTLEGDVAGGPSFQLRLADDGATITLGEDQHQVTLNEDLAAQRVPEGSGGLGLALTMWRRMLRLGPEKYGDVFYLGTVPMRGREELVDVLVATHDVVETHFLFDPESGRMLGLEMFPDSNVDPCELYFDDYQPVSGSEFPHQILVRHGDRVFAQLVLTRCVLMPPGEDDA